jgi:hypothetical protein
VETIVWKRGTPITEAAGRWRRNAWGAGDSTRGDFQAIALDAAHFPRFGSVVPTHHR